MSKVAIVTGASRGIGAATAKQLATQCYSVCVNYLNNQKAASIVVDSIQQAGGQAIAYQADVSIEAGVESLFGRVNDTYGEVTHLVNNVGVLFQQKTFKEITLDRFEKTLNSNIVSCFLCSKAFVNQSKSAGAIVNVSSLAAKTGSPFEYIDYAVTKGAMDTMTKGLAMELAPQGIRVNAVRPGFIYTDIHKDGGEPNRVDRLASQIPLGRGGSPNEVANLITWLLSDEASYMTGALVDVSGGR